MAFRRKNGAVARPHRGADILRLARLLGDDELVGHNNPSPASIPAACVRCLTGAAPLQPAHRPAYLPDGRLRSASGSASLMAAGKRLGELLQLGRADAVDLGKLRLCERTPAHHVEQGAIRKDDIGRRALLQNSTGVVNSLRWLE